MKISDLPELVKKRPTALLILMYLGEEEKGETIMELAQGIGITEAAISKSVELLHRHDLIDKTHGKGRKGRRTTIIKLKK
jgi:predicted transcriptional regulator